jgi:hypothetical protein
MGGALSHDDVIVSTRPRRNISKSSGACGEMVSPADVPAICDFNRLICPTRSNALLERKSEFPKLSNRVHGAALLPGAPSPRTMRSATRHDRK